MDGPVFQIDLVVEIYETVQISFQDGKQSFSAATFIVHHWVKRCMSDWEGCIDSPKMFLPGFEELDIFEVGSRYHAEFVAPGEDWGGCGVADLRTEDFVVEAEARDNAGGDVEEDQYFGFLFEG